MSVARVDLIEARIAELGIVLPEPFPPVGSYVSCRQSGDLLFVCGHGPIDGARTVVGKVGADLTLEEGREAARMTPCRSWRHARGAPNVDRVEQLVKVFGMVNVGGAFNQTPAVIDRCSDLLVEVFGERGRHTRSAVGVAALPFDIAVEIEVERRL